MKIKEIFFGKVKLLEPTVHGDHRGFFTESYNLKSFLSIGIENTFVQDNHSKSASKGTLRGLHYQKTPMAQAKLIRVIKGSILDVAVDIRNGSPTYGKHIAVELNEMNKLQLFVPEGFAHGFVTLEDNTEVCYKVDQYYSPEFDRNIVWSDPSLGIKWGFEAPILSEKDAKAPLLVNADNNFIFSL